MSSPATGRSVRIGGASGYWGDSPDAARQLVLQGDIHYLVFDYLAEVTLSVLVRAKAKDPAAGYAADFVELVMKPLLQDIKARGIRVVSNAGGVNVRACAAALAQVAEAAGVPLKIGIVEGDDLLPQIEGLREAGVTEMFTGAALPRKLISANAYLGAFPIAAALDAGADVVITGRCVDSAVTLGPLIHEFGWRPEDYDQLAAGTLAGHIIECGAQATGGNFTDWRETAAGWDDMGYPIADCRADGTFAITKPAGTGGRVSVLTVSEQLLYEIGDPSAYLMPDVVADFSHVRLRQDAPDRVEVSGARGRAPTPTYKVSATYPDGFRVSAATCIVGFEAAAKAQAYMDALLKRVDRMLDQRGLGGFRGRATYVFGADASYGPKSRHAFRDGLREVQARVEVHHASREALELFSKEVTGAGLAMTPGRIPSAAAGKPKVTPVVALFSFLIDKSRIRVHVEVDGQPVAIPKTSMPAGSDEGVVHRFEPGRKEAADEPHIELPLIALAVARGGDKGNKANIALIARSGDFLPLLARQVSPQHVADWFSHVAMGPVQRFYVPGLDAFNFLLHDCLDGGGTSSLRLDTQAKTYAQQLLAMPVRVPASLAERHGLTPSLSSN